MYDIQAKKALIRELVAVVFNSAEDSTLDGSIIAEYICEVGCEYGSSNEQSFFGRATLTKSPASLAAQAVELPD